MLLMLTVLFETEMQKTIQPVNTSKLNAEHCTDETIYTDKERALKDPERICYLDLSFKEYNLLSSELLSLRNLKELKLQGTTLTAVPFEIGQLRKLEVLDVTDSTEIISIPSTIGLLSQLRILELGGTAISVLPAEVGALKKLRKLDLSHNELNALPEELTQIQTLEILSLRNNNIIVLPVEIDKWINLKEIDITNNPIDSAELERIRTTLPNVKIIGLTP
jgi:Leucine-rich repeat (LRR) protein